MTTKENSMKPHNLKNGKRVPVTHGELWFQPTDEVIPEEAETHTSYVVGHSETGHHHVLEAAPDTTFKVMKSDTLMVFLSEAASVVHKKTFDIHDTRILAPGTYRVFTKKEYNPVTKLVQRVFD